LQTRSCIPKKTSFPLGKSIKIKNPPPAGHYSFTYTPSFAGPTWTTSFAFNSNSSSTHTFLIDNISMCPINAVQPITSYSADILMHTDYYAFGQQQPGRTWQGTAEGYRYSHNSHEKEDALFKGAQSAEYWMYDSRIGRRWEMDPIMDETMSPYACFANSPIFYDDPEGLKPGGDDKKSNKVKNEVHNEKGHFKRGNDGKFHKVGGGKDSKDGANTSADATAVKQPRAKKDTDGHGKSLEGSFHDFLVRLDNFTEHSTDWSSWDQRFVGKPTETKFGGTHQWGGGGSKNIGFTSVYVDQEDKVNINSGAIWAGLKGSPKGRHLTDEGEDLQAIGEYIYNLANGVNTTVDTKAKGREMWRQHLKENKPRIAVPNDKVIVDTAWRKVWTSPTVWHWRQIFLNSKGDSINYLGYTPTEQVRKNKLRK